MEKLTFDYTLPVETTKDEIIEAICFSMGYDETTDSKVTPEEFAKEHIGKLLVTYLGKLRVSKAQTLADLKQEEAKKIIDDAEKTATTIKLT